MVIFNSYVSLPEGNTRIDPIRLLAGIVVDGIYWLADFYFLIIAENDVTLNHRQVDFP